MSEKRKREIAEVAKQLEKLNEAGIHIMFGCVTSLAMVKEFKHIKEKEED